MQQYKIIEQIGEIQGDKISVDAGDNPKPTLTKNASVLFTLGLFTKVVRSLKVKLRDLYSMR